MNASPESIRPNVARLRERPSADVLIIGAGINGIATFRDLALQGVDVALVERGDYVSGASSASSHMIHGGIRYLENGEFRLVQESVTERNRLLKTAPHYVRPARNHDPDLLDVLRDPLRALPPARHSRPWQAPRAWRGAHQDGPHDVRHVLARRRPGAAPPVPREEEVARGAPRDEP